MSNKELNKIKSYFLNLFSIALAERDIHHGEFEILYDIGLEKGFTKIKEFGKILSLPQDEIEFYIPETSDKKFEQLYELTRMIIADRKIKKEETDTIKLISYRFGIKDEFIEPLINELTVGVKLNDTKENIYSKVKKYIALN